METPDGNSSKLDVTRRELVKMGAVSASVGSLGLSASIVSADETSYFLGERLFVEIALTHTRVPDKSPVVACGKPTYITSETDDIVGLLRKDKWPSNSQSGIVSTRWGLHGLQDDHYGYSPRKRLILEREPQGEKATILDLEESYTPPKPEIKINKHDTCDISVEGHEIELQKGEEVTLPLDKRKIEYKPDPNETELIKVEHPQKPGQYITREIPIEAESKTGTVQPKLTLKSYGKVGFYGGEGVSIIPTNTEHPVAHSKLKNSGELNKDETNNLLIIDKGGEANE